MTHKTLKLQNLLKQVSTHLLRTFFGGTVRDPGMDTFLKILRICWNYVCICLFMQKIYFWIQNLVFTQSWISEWTLLKKYSEFAEIRYEYVCLCKKSIFEVKIWYLNSHGSRNGHFSKITPNLLKLGMFWQYFFDIDVNPNLFIIRLQICLYRKITFSLGRDGEAYKNWKYGTTLCALALHFNFLKTSRVLHFVPRAVFT